MFPRMASVDSPRNTLEWMEYFNYEGSEKLDTSEGIGQGQASEGQARMCTCLWSQCNFQSRGPNVTKNCPCLALLSVTDRKKRLLWKLDLF